MSLDAGTAAVLGAAVGVVGGGAAGTLTAWATSRWQLTAAREARAEERRSSAYSGVLSNWMSFQDAAKAIVDGLESNTVANQQLSCCIPEISRHLEE